MIATIESNNIPVTSTSVVVRIIRDPQNSATCLGDIPTILKLPLGRRGDILNNINTTLLPNTSPSFSLVTLDAVFSKLRYPIYTGTRNSAYFFISGSI